MGAVDWSGSPAFASSFPPSPPGVETGSVRHRMLSFALCLWGFCWFCGGFCRFCGEVKTVGVRGALFGQPFLCGWVTGSWWREWIGLRWDRGLTREVVFDSRLPDDSGLVTVVLETQQLISVKGSTFGSGLSELFVVVSWGRLQFSALESVGWRKSWVLVRVAAAGEPGESPKFALYGIFYLGLELYLDRALFPSRFVRQLDRTVRDGGVCMVTVEEYGPNEVKEIVKLFKKSRFVDVENMSLAGERRTRIVMKVDENS
ncbi:S-adenosyl-L-methionine-dependentmethyltransferases superfamily protein [Striga asiatica]|uniref:S-adenosyl-L-methionine-dependentmethyltransferases superfamily protein n=1 Tax=Striga asiatica TaxID=4170 RepID=A0A5A7QX77_STRAF|nr:S-adenosyl-L-methionine-dependentmethyltransferases superfamily protein [Striga asiatica]